MLRTPAINAYSYRGWIISSEHWLSALQVLNCSIPHTGRFFGVNTVKAIVAHSYRAVVTGPVYVFM